MIVYCRKCKLPFREDDEVQGTMKAFWHELASRVSYSVSHPHGIEKDTLEHVIDCTEEQLQ